VKDPDQLITWSRSDGLPDRLWAGNTGEDGERSAAALSGGLANLGFFTAVLRRKARVWCLTALLGLVIGTGLYVKFPPAYHASATVLLVYNPGTNSQVQVQNEASVAQSQPVAARVVQELKLPQSVASFLAAYTVTAVTANALTIDVGAPSSTAAMQRATAVATAFLQYRAQYARAQEQQQYAQLQQQYNAAQQRLQALNAQSSQLPSTLSTPAEKAEYSHLQSQISQQGQILQFVNGTELTTKTDTNALVAGSYVLNPATALPRSHIKGPALYFVGGLFGGLVVGMAGVIIAALLSRRLRNRNDVAIALGAPVRLSVGRLRPRRWPTRPGRAAKRKLDMKRVAIYLRGAVPGSSRGPATLAVVAVDDARVVAQAFASLAASCAAEGKQVVVADLSGGAYLARLLRVRDPGIHNVSQDGANLVLFLPQPEDVAPVGPVPSGASPAGPAQVNPALLAACSSADLVLTFVTLDPAFGADHLGTWATSVVVVVTAGESTAEKVLSVGEMIRLAGTRLDSAVLIGADKTDESLGVPDLADQSALVNPL